MKILIISTFFPPLNSIASLRPYSWAKYWSEMGCDVTVVTTRKEKSPADLNFSLNGFNLKIIDYKIPLLKIKEASRGGEALSGFNFIGTILIFLKKMYLLFVHKTGCFYGCRFPDWHDIWAKNVIKNLANEKFDVVVSTGGPYSVHRVGLYFKNKNPHVIWVVDWRDLWTKNHNFKGFFCFRWYERSLEASIHNSADIVTTVSDGLAQILSGNINCPVYVVHNGFDLDNCSKIFETERLFGSNVLISYTGSIYDGYDITPFFIAVSNLISKKSIKADDVKIVSAGCNSDFSDIARRFGLGKNYTYLGFLTRNKSLDLQYNSDISLFLESKMYTPGILTGKLFEYLFLASQIWSIGSPVKTEADILIEKTNTGEYLGSDVQKIEHAILMIVNNKKNGVINKYQKNMNIINKFTRRNQAIKMLNIFRNI